MTTPRLDALLNSKAPEVLFHYTGLEGLHGMVTTKSAWATAVPYLSDSRELRYAIDLARSRLVQLKGEVPTKSRLLDYLANQLERIENLFVCVFSLSENGDLLSQWRGYCPTEAGYSLGFETASLLRCIRAQGFILAPCVYESGLQELLIREAVDPIAEQLPAAEPVDEKALKAAGEAVLGQLFPRVAHAAALIKDPSFSEEHEWRAVWMLTNPNDLRYRPGRKMMIPYVPLKLDVGGPMTLRRVVVGPTPHQYIASNSMTGYLSKQDVRWKELTPSRIPYRQL